MTTGIVFDIKEFAINDGPGIRLTVFMKGCPLHCMWCHNPEGLSIEPQLNNKTNRIVGIEYSTDEIISRITKFKDVFDLSEGGVTFSGGEPTMQSDFIYQIAKQIPDIHKTLDTSGYCQPEIFSKIISVFDLIYFDLKIINNNLHEKYTGVPNQCILQNLKTLDEMNIPYHIRIPLIPDITDTEENLSDILNIILSLKNKPLRVDPLPYNILAGGKYDNFNMVYPLKDKNSQNNSKNIENFKQKLKDNKINIIGDEIKCLANA